MWFDITSPVTAFHLARRVLMDDGKADGFKLMGLIILIVFGAVFTIWAVRKIVRFFRRRLDKEPF